VLPKPELFPELVDELEAFEYSLTEHGNFRSGAPHGYHDGCVIALGQGAWSLKRGDRRPSISHGADPLHRWGGVAPGRHRPLSSTAAYSIRALKTPSAGSL
jgi:hypothetical protein